MVSASLLAHHIMKIVLTFFTALILVSSASAQLLDWSQLPPIPDQEGFATPFAGVVQNQLVVAGGANFPDAKPWDGGQKVWYDTVFALPSPEAEWKRIGQLPRPLGYGVSISTDEGLICIGGSAATAHHAEAFRIQLNGSTLAITDLPSLPSPCANMSGALLGNTIYVAGGIDESDATEALLTVWTLDLDHVEAGWKTIEPWPGPGRMLAATGAQDGSFFIVGGAALKAGSDGKPERIWLQDGYRYTPGKGWRQIADTPQVSVAAPSPMPTVGASTLLLIGGDDGAQVTVAPSDHKGFPKTVFAYHTVTDTWRSVGEIPLGLVTTSTVQWNDHIVVPGGERMPGTRSNQVWSGTLTLEGKTPFGWLNYTTLFAYLAGMVGIGWFCSRGNHTTDDYFKGGGNIPWWAAGMSIFATMLSSLTFMSVPAKAYMTDWTFLWANLPILFLAPFIIGIYLPFFRKLQITTAYEYLEKRFNLAARLYGSAAFILFQLGRQAIVLLLPALALATVSDLDVNVCILLMGALCVAYTTMGGIRAVIWTDVVQTFVLIGAALLTLVLVISGTEGGIGGFFEIAQTQDKMHSINWNWDATKASNAFWVIIIGNLFINLVPYTSDQTVVQRYMTTKDEKSASRSIWTNALMAMPSTLLFFLIGTALFVFYRTHPQSLDAQQTPDAIFPAFILQNLPAGIAGIVIAGIFAAAQSTVSSSLNSVSTVLTVDVWQRLGWTTEAKSLRLAKTLTIIVGVFATVAALVLAELNLKSLWDAYNSLVGLAGSGLAGLFALGIFSKRAHGMGALIGALTSALVLYFVQQTNLHFFLYAAVGIVTCVSVGWIASILLPGTPHPEFSRGDAICGVPQTTP